MLTTGFVERQLDKSPFFPLIIPKNLPGKEGSDMKNEELIWTTEAARPLLRTAVFDVIGQTEVSAAGQKGEFPEN